MVPGKGSRQGADADFFVDSQDGLAEAEGDGRQVLEQLVQCLLFRQTSVGVTRNRKNLVSCTPDPDPLVKGADPGIRIRILPLSS